MRHARETQPGPLYALQVFVAYRDREIVDLSRTSLSYGLEEELFRIKSVEGRLRGRCCGLLEVVYTGARGKLKEPKLQFLHRTVYDYLCNTAIWERVTNMHRLSEVDADLSLLGPCVHLMKHRALFQSKSTVFGMRQFSELFAASLEYSSKSKRSGCEDYVRYLAAADGVLLHYCSDAQAYREACNMSANCR